MTTLIAFKNRKLSDLLNQKLVHLARESPKFDVDLVSTNGKVVPAHRLILSMYSPYLRRLLANASPEVKILVPLVDYPYSVLEKVVDLFYYGQVRVLTSLKAKTYKALSVLEVDVPYPDPPKTRTKLPPIQELVLPSAGEQTNSAPTNVNNGQQPPPPSQHQQQQQQHQQQRPAKQSPNSVLNKPTTYSADVAKGKDDSSSDNGGGNAQVKSSLVTGITAGSNNIVYDDPEIADSTANGATFSSVDFNKSDVKNATNLAISSSILYDDDIGDNIDELEKEAEDLLMEIGTIGSKAINTKNPNNGETGQTQ